MRSYATAHYWNTSKPLQMHNTHNNPACRKASFQPVTFRCLQFPSEQPPTLRNSIYIRTTEVIKRDYPRLANPSGNTDNRVSRHARPEPGITGI